MAISPGRFVATFAASILLFSGGSRSAEDAVAMVYLIGPDRIQVIASDIISVDVGGMTQDGWKKRTAVRVCFNDAIHKRILALVNKNLAVNDHFKIVVGCAVAADMRIKSLQGTGNCNFFTSDTIYRSLALADEIKKGMTKANCAQYISRIDRDTTSIVNVMPAAAHRRRVVQNLL